MESKREKEYFTKSVLSMCHINFSTLYHVQVRIFSSEAMLLSSVKLFIKFFLNVPDFLQKFFLFFKYKCIPIGVCKISLANLNNEG